MTTKPLKDANDVRKAYGPGALAASLAAAEPFELPDEPKAKAKPAKAEKAPPPEIKAVGEVLESALARMRRRSEGKERPIPVPWDSVGEKLGGGLWPGLHVLTSTTGSGKTQFALQLVLSAALGECPSLYIGLELDHDQIIARLLALLSARDDATSEKWSRLYLGKVPSRVITDLGDRYGEQLGALPLRLEAGSPHGWDYNKLRASVSALRAAYPENTGPDGKAVRGSRPLLVVLDFLQLVSSPEDAREDLRERISRAAYVARRAAVDFDAAILLVSSTSREHYKLLSAGNLAAANPASFIGTGKESGDVEYSADTVLSLAREQSEGDKAAPEPGPPSWLFVAKGRAVPPSRTALSFDGNAFRGLSPLEASAVKEEPREHRVSVPRGTKGRGRRAKT